MSQVLMVGIAPSGHPAKKDFAVACCVEAVETELGKFVNEAEGYELLQTALVRECTRQGMTQIQLVLEATGGYEAALMAYAYCFPIYL